MVVEILGRWQNTRPDDGPGRRSVFGNRKKTEKKTHHRLSVGESALPQLVGLQILFLRTSGPHQRCG